MGGAESARRIHAGVNEGEVRNDRARAVYFNRLGELRDRTYENQRYRASGLNLVVAAMVLWNTVHLERAVKALRERGEARRFPTTWSPIMKSPALAPIGKLGVEKFAEGSRVVRSFDGHDVSPQKSLAPG